MTPAQPAATIDYQVPGVMTVWLVTLPGSASKPGASYFATTYPGSERVRMETVATRRQLSDLQCRKILPQIRAAIEAASSAA